MKTISEKAKAYDEVVEKLSKLYRDYDSVSNLIDVKEELGNILPEIKESKDERMRKVAIEACKYMVDNFENSTQQYTDAISWLEKQGEQKPAWSEEDKVKINRIVACLKNLNVADNDILLKDVAWLKSIKERYTWKPSKGQLECLGYAIEKAEKNWSPLTNNRIYLTLKALKEQLEKL